MTTPQDDEITRLRAEVALLESAVASLTEMVILKTRAHERYVEVTRARHGVSSLEDPVPKR